MTLRDARSHLSAVIEEANTERVLITSHGRPAALVIGVAGLDTEEVLLVSNPNFWKMIEESRRKDRTLTSAEVRARIARRAKAEAARPATRRRRRAKALRRAESGS
jgi:prevent-host-death family protein